MFNISQLEKERSVISMSTIYTVEGNTSGGSTLVSNGGCVAKKSYQSNYSRIAKIWFPKGMTEGEANKVCKVALKYIGYLEKNTCSYLEDFTKNAGYNNWNRFAPYSYDKTKCGVYVNGVAWCDIFVDAVFIEALGVKRAKELLYDWSAYTPMSSNYLKKSGAKEIHDFSKAPKGSIIFFKNDKRICHTGIVVTDVTSSDGTLTPPATVYYTKKDFIKEVCKILKVKTPQEALAKTVTLSKKCNRYHALVLPLQKYLHSLGYYKKTIDRDFSSGTADAVNLYQKNVLKYRKTDGEVTARNKMWKSLLGLI